MIYGDSLLNVAFKQTKLGKMKYHGIPTGFI
jgi:hypothetical protein